MKIVIETIPHKAQRYETCGDWFFDAEGTLQVRVSDLADYRKEAMIGIHEAIEALLCRANKIKQSDVDKFDNEYEERRAAFLAERDAAWGRRYWEGSHITENSEPGDHPAAPYRKEHCFATSVERMLCAAFGMSWSEYEEAVLAL